MPLDYDSHLPLDGQRATESTHRKIELQSPADLTYLIANVSRAAREKIEKNLPAASEDDPMRRRVEVLVDEFIRQTFSAAKDSISINGMDSKELERELRKVQEGEELEPFDAKLAQRVQSLSAQIEHQTLELANLRRGAPQATARNFTRAFEKQSEEYEARMKSDREKRLEVARGTNVDVGRVERVEEMGVMYLKGTEDLKGLRERIGGTMKRMEKAQRAVDATVETK